VAEILCPAVTGVRRIRLWLGGGVIIFIQLYSSYIYDGCTIWGGVTWMVVLANPFKIFYAIITIGR